MRVVNYSAGGCPGHEMNRSSTASASGRGHAWIGAAVVAGQPLAGGQCARGRLVYGINGLIISSPALPLPPPDPPPHSSKPTCAAGRDPSDLRHVLGVDVV